MKNFLVFFILFALTFSPQLLAADENDTASQFVEENTASYEPAPVESEPAASGITDPALAPVAAAIDPTEEVLAEARQAAEEGKLAEAQKLYQDVLQDHYLSDEKKQKLTHEFHELNLKMLYSQYEMPGSTVYTVQPGDNLIKIAKQFGTTVALIRKSNAIKGDMIRVGQKLKVVDGTFSVQVDKTDNVMTIELNGKPFYQYEVATGTEGSTPVGEYTITNKLENPTWYKAGAVVPPGSKENQLGTRWMGFNYPGYGIHGTTEPETIGQSVTSGCVRMRNEEVEALYDILPVGVKVTITE